MHAHCFARLLLGCLQEISSGVLVLLQGQVGLSPVEQDGRAIPPTGKSTREVLDGVPLAPKLPQQHGAVEEHTRLVVIS